MLLALKIKRKPSSQGMWGAFKAGRGKETDSPITLGRNEALPTSWFLLPVTVSDSDLCKAMRQQICVILSH